MLLFFICEVNYMYICKENDTAYLSDEEYGRFGKELQLFQIYQVDSEEDVPKSYYHNQIPLVDIDMI